MFTKKMSCHSLILHCDFRAAMQNVACPEIDGVPSRFLAFFLDKTRLAVVYGPRVPFRRGKQTCMHGPSQAVPVDRVSFAPDVIARQVASASGLRPGLSPGGALVISGRKPSRQFQHLLLICTTIIVLL